MVSLAVVPTYTPTIQDRMLENKIQLTLNTFNSVKDPAKRRKLWARFTRLHATRSPEYVSWMEKRKGLHRE